MRRTTFKTLAVLVLAGGLVALALLVGGAAGGNGHGKGRGGHGSTPGGQHGYHFLVLDAPAAGSGLPATDRLLFQGDGGITGDNRAHGGGSFDHFQGVGNPPLPIVASGTWEATDVVSFTPSSAHHGPFEGGVLRMHATFFPDGQAPIRGVLVEVYCNLGPIGFNTGHAEGVDVTFPGATHPEFTQTNAVTSPVTGITIFTVPKSDQG
jgi:hypothetical protein